MKFFLKSTLRTFGLLCLLFVPLLVLISLFALSREVVPLFNIGVRNFFRFTMGYLTPALVVSYLLATLLVVATVDKMQVKSILVLHLPALAVGILVGGFLYFSHAGQSTRVELPFSLEQRPLRLGPNSFIERGVFLNVTGTDAKNLEKLMYLDREGRVLYLYDRQSGRMMSVRDVRFSRNEPGGLYVDRGSGHVVVVPGRSRPVRIPFGSFTKDHRLLSNPLLNGYLKQAGKISAYVRSWTGRLNPTGSLIFAGALLLSLLMIAIPLTYGFNDKGWGFAGLAGAFLVLGVLPLFCSFSLDLIERFQLTRFFPDTYSYLLPPAFFAGCGFLLDILVSRRKAR